MSEQHLVIILIVIAACILGVLVYNAYKEKKYRDDIRAQFGHADKDALFDAYTESVRDHQESRNGSDRENAPLLKPSTDKKTGRRVDDNAVFVAVADSEAGRQPDLLAASAAAATETEQVLYGGAVPSEQTFDFQETAAVQLPRTLPHSDDGKLLVSFKDLIGQELPWFDKRFDYMAYIALPEARELNTLPMLSERRCRIVGCTTDDCFDIAEPLPGKYYQGFIIGLQGISRNGLVSRTELEHFGERVDAFAAQLGGRLRLTDTESFLHIAQPLDELCARVDQTIVIHLVSDGGTIDGVTLRTALEHQNFTLSHDGMFYYNDSFGRTLFAVSNLDNSPFTSVLLSEHNYRGFSMLFDTANIPDGESNFNLFMDIAYKLLNMMDLDLVNDKLEELSPKWMSDVRSYVVDRHDEMHAVGIEAGGDLAKRLFS